MSRWSQAFKNHEIHNLLKSWDDIISFAESDLSPDSDSYDGIIRIRHVYKILRSAINRSDPETISTQSLSNFASWINDAVNQLNNYKSSKSESHILDANNAIEPILMHLSQLNYIKSKEEARSTREAVEQVYEVSSKYRDIFIQSIEKLEESIQENQAKLDNISNIIDSQKQRLDNAISNFQEQFSKAESNRSERFASSESSRTEEYNKLLSDLKSQRDKLIKDISARFKNLISSSSKDMLDIKSNLKESSEEIMVNLGSLKSQAEGLVGLIANTGMQTGYQRVADQEHKLSTRWNYITMGAFAGLIAFAILAFQETIDSEAGWFAVGGRAFTAVAFGIAAAYAARRAEKHHEGERRNRRIELELASIDLFISSLPEETKHDVKKGIAERLFAQEESGHILPEKPTSGNALDLVKLALDSLQQVLKDK